MRTFISFNEARKIVLDSAVRVPTEMVRFNEATGRTLAQDVVSVETIPPFDNSAMDGFAVRWEDVQQARGNAAVRLSVAADIPAGAPFKGLIEAGQAARIMTGAPVPRGVDTIVPVEKTHTDDTRFVWIDEAPGQAAHIRRMGEEISAGDRVLRTGTVVTPPTVGMLATLGQTTVEVSIPPRVAVISTGDELVPPSETPGAGQIRNSNGPALAAQTVSAGGRVCYELHVGDNPDAIRRVIEEIQGVDLFVFSGGVSMGEYDYVRTELDRLGATWNFWKVRQRPGKPLAFGSLNSTPVIGLPGNPVSSSICFEMYGRPLIAKMLGRTEIVRKQEPAILTSDIPKAEALYTFARGILGVSHGDSVEQNVLTVSVTGNQASSRFSSMTVADCIIHLPDGLVEARAGMTVMIERLVW